MEDLTAVGEFRLKLFPKDFYKVRDFYEKELGWEVTEQWDRPESKGVMFKVGNTTLELLTPEKGYEPVAGFGLSLEVPDVWQLCEQMKHKPYFLRELQYKPWGDSSFRIRDPEGLEITFFSHGKR
jgi:catechol 2,3-dioxygenase-like lactoylglutathione lyase family enzyme